MREARAFVRERESAGLPESGGWPGKERLGCPIPLWAPPSLRVVFPTSCMGCEHRDNTHLELGGLSSLQVELRYL